MPRKSKKPVRKQTHSPTGKVVGQVGQIPSVATSSSLEVGRGGVASTLRRLPRRRPASRASVESGLGGRIDPKLRIESGQTRGQVEVSWHE